MIVGCEGFVRQDLEMLRKGYDSQRLWLQSFAATLTCSKGIHWNSVTNWTALFEMNNNNIMINTTIHFKIFT